MTTIPFSVDHGYKFQCTQRTLNVVLDMYTAHCSAKAVEFVLKIGFKINFDDFLRLYAETGRV